MSICVETKKQQLVRLGVSVPWSNTWGTIHEPVICYQVPVCRWKFYSMCYCPMPGKRSHWAGVPIAFLYYECRGRFKNWFGVDNDFRMS